MSEIELNTESKIDLIAVDLDIHDQRIDGLEHSVQCIRQLHNINNNSNHNKPNNNKKRRKRKKDKKRRKQRRRRQRAAYEQAHQAKFVDVAKVTHLMNAASPGHVVSVKYPTISVLSVLEGLSVMGLVKSEELETLLARNYSWDYDDANRVTFYLTEKASFINCHGGPVPSVIMDNAIVSALNRDSNPKWMFITKYFGEKCRDSSMSLRCDYLVQLNANSKLLRAARNGMSEMFNDCDNGDEMNTNNQANINHPSANVEMNQNNVEMDRNDDNDDDDMPPNLDFLETDPFALRYA
eukprot:57659_1